MKKINAFYCACLLSALFTACSPDADDSSAVKDDASTTITSQEEINKINQWFEQQYEKELSFSPIQLTFQGSKERYAEIDDLSEDAEQEQLAWKRASVAEMKRQFDYELLDAPTKMSWNLWEYQLQQAQAADRFTDHQYVFHQMSGIHAFLPTFLMNFHKVESEQDFVDYASRISGVSRAIEQLVERVDKYAQGGVRAPRFAYEIVRQQSQSLLTGTPFSAEDEADSSLWADANRKAETLVEGGQITAERKDEILKEIKEALLTNFAPAYQGLIAYLDGDIENTSEDAQGVSALPNGAAYYNDRLQQMTTTAKSADEIHQIGLDEVERIRSEMVKLKDKAGFEGDLQAFFTFIRDAKDDARFYYPNDDAGRQGYIDDATAAIENIKAQLPNFFGLLPKADLVVKRVEAFREQDGAPQHYYPGTPDGSRSGIYYAHLSDMSAMPKNQLEVIAYHEGLPGHHMQISIAQELTGIPTFRTQAGFAAYSEGWGLYSELLSKEIPGTYVDVYSDFGRLTTEIWRAIRLVVDTGLHAKGWSQQQAVDYFAANSAASLPAIEAEVRRYLVIPGQATAYKIGMLEIQRLRAKAEQELGEKFDIRAFHDAILGGGALPLELLERRVNTWIEQVMAS